MFDFILGFLGGFNVLVCLPLRLWFYVICVNLDLGGFVLLVWLKTGFLVVWCFCGFCLGTRVFWVLCFGICSIFSCVDYGLVVLYLG